LNFIGLFPALSLLNFATFLALNCFLRPFFTHSHSTVSTQLLKFYEITLRHYCAYVHHSNEPTNKVF